MHQPKKFKINFSLIENFGLSDKAVFAYVALLLTYRAGQHQTISPLAMVKNIFGAKASKMAILRFGLKELLEKGIIKISYQKERTVLYDLTFIEDYECNKYLYTDDSFFTKFDELTGPVCNLYRAYITLEFLINYQESHNAGPVLETHKNSLASVFGISRNVVGKRLKELQELEFIKYEDCSFLPPEVVAGKKTLFITKPENGELLSKAIEKTFPKKYFRTTENEERDYFVPEKESALQNFIDNLSLENFSPNLNTSESEQSEPTELNITRPFQDPEITEKERQESKEVQDTENTEDNNQPADNDTNLDADNDPLKDCQIFANEEESQTASKRNRFNDQVREAMLQDIQKAEGSPDLEF